GDVLIMMAQKSAHREGLTTLREARRLGIPVILLTNALDSRFSPRWKSLIRLMVLTARCGTAEATDQTIISRHNNTVPCSGVFP
ncbi:hypothetical protein MMS56_28945, partial [Escherichia coli]|nr:hypothetical protein [Escherichia coli]